MFWKQRERNKRPNVEPAYASDIVSQVGGIFSGLNDQGQLIKPRSALPCSWFAVREYFTVAYEEYYLQMPEELKNAYDEVYGELAFFVDDDLCRKFNTSLDVAARCRVEKLNKIGAKTDIARERQFLTSFLVKYKDRGGIFETFSKEDTCPRKDMELIAETLSHCSELYRAMSAEWSAFTNLISYQNK